jgi:hypothetical protein
MASGHRLVRYYVDTDRADQVEGDMRHRWTVAIVNQPREIERIITRLLSDLALCKDVGERYKAPVSGSGGLTCEIIEFDSEKGGIAHPKKVYDADLRRDRSLSNLKDGGLDDYVARITSSG